MAECRPSFEYRTWSISAMENWDLLDLTLDRALQEVPRHHVNCIEIQDYTPPETIGWVDAASRFRSRPRLAQAEALTFHGNRVTREQREAITRRFKAAAEKVHKAGLQLQVWYHCFRDWPREATEWHPELREADGQALYGFLEEQLRDTFECFPEIDGLTVTSLHETPSILKFDGSQPKAERMLRLYKTLAGVCRELGKRLILRDFIVRQSEFDDFDAVLDRLPDDVIIQTKNVVADWSAHEKPINPFIVRYARKPKRLVVEFELANNYTGETDFPWCDPEQIWRHIRLLACLGAYGCVGRLVNTERLQAGTIFDTPNEVNVWAFSRTLVDPGRLLVEPGDTWWHDYDHFDTSIWTDWARLRFGERAASEVIFVLQQTPRLVDLTMNICGAFFEWPWRGEKRDAVLDHYVPFAFRAVEKCGAAHALAEKAEAERICAQAIERIERLRPVMPADGYRIVREAFERARHVVAIYRATAEAFIAAIDAHAGRADRSGVAAAAERLRSAAKRAEEAYGPRLCEMAPMSAPGVADYLKRLPDRLATLMENRGLY